MDRNMEQHEALVDLGQASVETQGNGIYPVDAFGPSLTPAAIRDDE
jgi:hypothetical protein